MGTFSLSHIYRGRFFSPLVCLALLVSVVFLPVVSGAGLSQAVPCEDADVLPGEWKMVDDVFGETTLTFSCEDGAITGQLEKNKIWMDLLVTKVEGKTIEFTSNIYGFTGGYDYIGEISGNTMTGKMFRGKKDSVSPTIWKAEKVNTGFDLFGIFR